MKIQVFRSLFILLFSLIFLVSFAQEKTKAKKKSKKDFLVTITTEFGNIYLILYDATPKHKENFIQLAQKHFYDSLLFHRVIDNFMIQGGDPNSKNAKAGERLGNGDVGYKIDAEFNPEIFHKRGSLAAARTDNPQKASSGCQFYIVQRKALTDQEIQQMEARIGHTIPDNQKEVYRKIGGTPHLDMGYTVFGEVIQGMDVVDKIASTERDPFDRPQKDLRMTIKVEELKKKKITKLFGYQFKE
ncbi:MAG: peptidylprolyl isomerase [Thermoflexibacter sp.]|jgi:peptidyl-prolyl cis-trans isomerase B (cyclophilin B)|nr:peptidylprolyl isomerase [Thermoflexibacter sp.]